MNHNQKPISSIIYAYLSYLALFVGTAFISGAIVHSGNVSEIPKYVVIGLIGLTLFVTGSFVQETIINKNSLQGTKLFKFLIFSLLLSVGIGMIGGGVQHFTDFPVYSSYLIPLGILLSLIAFLFKNNYAVNTKLWLSLLGVFAIISGGLHFGLMTYANTLVSGQGNCSTHANLGVIIVNAGEGHSDTNCKTTISPNQNKLIHGIDHGSISNSSEIKDDKTFIEYVIPHHQDAVNSSHALLQNTTDPELKTFLNNVITNQSKEIALLKDYHKTWFGKEYKDNGNYQAMVKMEGKSGQESEKQYIQGLLGHHSGIINVAKKVVSSDIGYTYKPETIALSRQIIKDQEADNIILQNWLDTKYKNVNLSHVEDDGHSH